ncbi:MAG: hypothetical protein GX452_01705 [Ignavibacteriales bacterium]|nr:hypothetical protein [Ignavibacteriales bacterium]
MISLIFLALASICNSIMDTTMFRFNTSIFKTDNQWWNTWWSDRSKRFWIVQLNDGWHFLKMWVVVFIILAIVFYQPIFIYYIDFWIYGLVWNLMFNLGYDILWRKR